MPIRVQVVGHGIVEFPDGTPQEEMQRALGSLSASEPTAPLKGQTAPGSTFGEKIRNAADMIGSALPAAGGVVGGIVGGAPGAVAGGAAGIGYRQLAQHATEIPGAIADVGRNLIAHPIETARGFVGGTNRGGADVAIEGASQAAGQAVGTGIVKGAGVMGKWLMNRATSRVSAKLMQEFPELSETLLDNALQVSEGGYGKARALLMTAKGKATAALAKADRAGSVIPVEMSQDLAESFKTALLEKAVKSGGVKAAEMGDAITAASKRLDPQTRALFAKVEQAAEQGDVLHLTPSQADLLKTQLQKESRQLYANRGAPNGPKAIGMDATERAEFATSLNNAIDGLASGYKGANAEAKPLIGAVRGIKQAIRPNGNLYQAMVRPAVGATLGGAAGGHEGGTPGSVAGAIAGAYATSPQGMSQEAIALAHPAVQQALRLLPRYVAAKLADFLSTVQPVSPPPSPGGSQ
jgi:hypothetical protein